MSKSWFTKTKNKDLVVKLKNNARNYLMNICGKNVDSVMWTTVKGNVDKKNKGDIEKKVCPKSYNKGFVSVTSRGDK